ncbi:hypothetical protein [Alistipes sp.]|uniref:NigD1/NigD2 family lipoprotein n=1 Tax=Alistipes sp. TaxID=1872444 RepID=UPI003AEF8618
MKKTGLLLLAAAAFLASCNDTDGDYAAYSYFVTVKTSTEAPYYFQLDDNKTLYPGDTSRIGAYKPEDGQRAILYFNLLPDNVPGYDYNIAAYYIRDIYTSEARIMTQDELDALADDAVSLIDAQLSGKYLTLRVAYPVSDNSKHKFRLVRVQTPQQTPTHEGYLDVELRHDADGDTGSDDYYYISFSLDELKEPMQGMKGLTLRVKTQLNGVKYVQISLR